MDDWIVSGRERQRRSDLALPAPIDSKWKDLGVRGIAQVTMGHMDGALCYARDSICSIKPDMGH